MNEVSIRECCSRGVVGRFVRNIQHGLTMLLECLARQDLGEDVGRVDRSRDEPDGHDACAAHLPHLEDLAVDVTRVLRRREAMTEIVCAGLPLASGK